MLVAEKNQYKIKLVIPKVIEPNLISNALIFVLLPNFSFHLQIATDTLFETSYLFIVSQTSAYEMQPL